MKIRKLLLSIAAVVFVFTAQAQKSERGLDKYISAGKDNFSISIGGGAQAYLNQDNADYGLKNVIKPMYSLSVGKMFTPKWGLRAFFSGYEAQSFTDINRLNNCNKYDEYNRKYVNFNIDFGANLTNLWRQYQERRVFDLMLYVGPGLNFGKFHGTKVDAYINGSVALEGKFYVSNSFAIDLQVRSSLTPSFFPEGRTAVDGILSANIGVSYVIGGRSFSKYTSRPVTSDAQYIDLKKQAERLAAENAAKQIAIDELNSRKPEVVEIVKTVPAKAITKEYPGVVTFAFNSAKIVHVQQVTVYDWAQILKANPSLTLKVLGYADKTGTEKANDVISSKRAEAVKDLLVKFGVAADRIEAVGKGVNTRYENNDWNRCVVFEPVIK